MPTQKKSSTWSLVGIAVAAVIISTTSIAMLNAGSNRAAKYERELNQLQAIANRLDALEWRSISKKKVDSELQEELKEQRERAQETLQTLKTNALSLNQMQRVQSDYQIYESAVNQLLRLLNSNQIQAALEADETLVDPSYARLYETINNATIEASNISHNLTRWANFGSVLIILSLVSALGILFRQYLYLNQQVQNFALEAMRQQQELLEQERQLLESRVIERTQALQTALSDLQQSQLKLIQQEKMSLLGQLVAGVAHEINNPLGFLAGNIQYSLDYVNDLFSLIELYQEQVPKPGLAIQEKIERIDLDYIRNDLPQLITSMKEGVTRIRDISTSLRTFSRADSTSPTAYNIHDGLDSTLQILKYQLRANDKRPTIEVIKKYGDLPAVECYIGQLNQVFMNLLANAIDALEELNQERSFEEIIVNPNRIWIETQLVNNSELAQISIKDNGRGITDEVKEKMFDRVFTTKAIGKGTGLGLAISHSIVVEKHAGTLEVKSPPGKGAEFIIKIPVKASISPP